MSVVHTTVPGCFSVCIHAYICMCVGDWMSLCVYLSPCVCARARVCVCRWDSHVWQYAPQGTFGAAYLVEEISSGTQYIIKQINIEGMSHKEVSEFVLVDCVGLAGSVCQTSGQQPPRKKCAPATLRRKTRRSMRSRCCQGCATPTLSNTSRASSMLVACALSWSMLQKVSRFPWEGDHCGGIPLGR